MEISRESQMQQRGLLLSTKSLNELLCILESIAIELTRDKSYGRNSTSKAQLNVWWRMPRLFLMKQRVCVRTLVYGPGQGHYDAVHYWDSAN